MTEDRYCNQCGAEWRTIDTKVIFHVCPFCSSDQVTKPPKKKETLENENH